MPLPSYTENVSKDTVNARNRPDAAGWYSKGDEPATGHWKKRLLRRKNPKWDSFSWLTVRALLESVNDVIAKGGPTVVRGRRALWIARQRAARVELPDRDSVAKKGSFGPDFVVDWTALKRPRFILLGDPGEADASQYAVVDPLLEVHAGNADGQSGGTKSDFMVILSDVIYPAGDVNEYINAFYRPYAEYDATIYALPGNHDWYDGLNGFMFHFCAAEALPKLPYRGRSFSFSERAARRLWRGASRPDREALAPWMSHRRRIQRGDVPLVPPGDDASGPPGFDGTHRTVPPPPRPTQPAPYFAIDTGPLTVVSIDTGVLGELDAEQADWLRRVSRSPKPKILLTGKPIYVNNEYHPCEIAWGEDAPESKRAVGGEARPLTVDDIVRERGNRYLAAIGGDVHNYQRYPVELVDERTIQYIVSGGGGAYLSATHMIPTVAPTVEQQLPPDVKDFKEKTFRCYPLRGDSLALFTRRIGPVLFNAVASAYALIVAAVLVLLFVVDDLSASEWVPVVASAALAAVLVIVIAGLFVLRDRVIAMLPDGYRTAILAAAAALIGTAVTVVLVAIGKHEASGAVGITLGLPFLLLAAVVLAYDLRGSAPRFSKTLLLIAPLIAIWEVFAPFDATAAVEVLAYLVAPLLFLLGSVAGLELAKRKLAPQKFYPPYRIALILSWTALTARVLWDHHGGHPVAADSWLTWTVVSLLGAALLISKGIPLLTSGDRRHHVPADPRRTGELAGAIVGIALVTLALLALTAIGDVFPAQVTVAALFAIPGMLSVFLLLALMGIGLWPRGLFHMRTGEIDHAYAAKYVADHIGGADPVRPASIEYDDESKRGMAKVIRRLGKTVSELADTNVPPFYKSLLDVEVTDEALTIRCYGVTGYASPWVSEGNTSPTLEDSITVPLAAAPGAPEAVADEIGTSNNHLLQRVSLRLRALRD